MTVALFVLLAVNFLLAYLWRSAEAENARLREDLDAPHDYAFVTRGAKAAQPDPDAIMAARLAAHNELRAHGEAGALPPDRPRKKAAK